ncbi:hypothetical protein HPB49_004342 [Dermacentor silvarum]|uniref:Uncharacterized protein n=1 Tax=Dermacentor silvarum TaxID=543639 RepID=A0ACB8DUP4_DERSI|nr:hypothetical protein HPB49_004342 [Dermacentor silvarum]
MATALLAVKPAAINIYRLASFECYRQEFLTWEPPVISHYEFRKDMQVGMRIKVFCTVVQGDPPFLFTWLKDGVPVVENGAPSSQAAINVHNERDYSMLSTDSLQLEHSGNYTCVVKNQAATTAYSAVLRVNEPPKWDVEPESAAVVQGRNVQLQCSASGTPQPIITWMIASDSTREEFLPLYNSHKYGLFPNGTLSIHQLEPEESGYYLCKASNGFGEDLSKLVFLTVKRKPTPEASAIKHGQQARCRNGRQQSRDEKRQVGRASNGGWMGDRALFSDPI